VRLAYTRGPGGQPCPADATNLRAEVGARMGYDPFERDDAPSRLAVTMVTAEGGFRAHVERFNARGVRTLNEWFPHVPMRDCEALTPPLAPSTRALIIPLPRPEPPEPRPEPPPTPAPTPPPSTAAPTAPIASPTTPPPPPAVPNRARITANWV